MFIILQLLDQQRKIIKFRIIFIIENYFFIIDLSFSQYNYNFNCRVKTCQQLS